MHVTCTCACTQSWCAALRSPLHTPRPPPRNEPNIRHRLSVIITVPGSRRLTRDESSCRVIEAHKVVVARRHDAAIIHGKVGGYSHAACRNGERVARHDQGGIVDASPCRSEFRERPHREVHLRRPLLADCE